jgi:aspartyl-tRNA(Asn)/glutamyl-tRNA(Gln) amidotransferase subunit C
MGIITGRDRPENEMTLSREQVAHVAMLARLGLSDEETERFREQLDAILAHVDRLQQVDTSQVAETAQIGGLVNAWREDVTGECLPKEAALRNAPRRAGDQFEVGAIQE